MLKPRVLHRASLACALFALVALAGCSGGSSPATGSAVPYMGRDQMARHLKSSGKIQHVVIIFQENRSFDNLFNGYPGADTATCRPKTRQGQARFNCSRSAWAGST